MLVAASEGAVSSDLVEALQEARLHRHRLEVQRVREQDELFYSLERHNPDLVVVGRMGRYRAGHLIHMLGLSERYRSVPMVAVVDTDTISPVQFGAADLMRSDTHGASEPAGYFTGASCDASEPSRSTS